MQLNLLLMHAFFIVFSVWFSIQPGDVSCSIIIVLQCILVPLSERGVGAALTQANGAAHREAEAEEKGPEGNDLDEQPDATVLLDFSTALAIFAHVNHVDDCVYNDAE